MVAPATVLGVTVAARGRGAAPVAAALAWAAMLPTPGHRLGGPLLRGRADGVAALAGRPPGAFLLAALSMLLLFCGPWLVACLRHRPGVVAGFAAVSLAAAWPAPDGALAAGGMAAGRV